MPPGVRSHGNGAHVAGPNMSAGGREADGCLETSGQAKGGIAKEGEEGAWPGRQRLECASIRSKDLDISLC